MKERVFIDSNIWIYALAPEDNSQYRRIMTVLKKAFRDADVVVSFQVINEVCFYLKKNGFSEDKIRKIILSFSRRCVVNDFSRDLLLQASALRKLHTFSYWDSLILASAIEAECQALYTEDMQDGRTVETVRIINPVK